MTESQRLRHLVGPARPRGRAFVGFLVGLGLALALFDGAILAMRIAHRDRVCACFAAVRP